jgi:signal recognition particle subunit SEC65
MDRKQIFNMRLRAVAKRSAIQHFQLSSMDSAYSQAILKHRYVPRVEETAYPRTVQFTIADDAPKSGS